MTEEKRPLKVFLCHAHVDKDAAKVLHDHLVQDGVDAWLDKEKLFAGANWEFEIRKAVRECDIFVVCVSQQFTQRFRRKNFAQTEVGIALDEAELKPKDQIYIIPVRLENCAVPKSLQRWHWVDLFESDGYQRLIRSLNKRIEELDESEVAKGHTGQGNISVVVNGDVSGNVIVGNENSVQQTSAQQPIEAEKQEIRMFYDLSRHSEHVVPNANAETIAKIILEAVTRIMWFTEIPDGNNEDRNIQYTTEKGEYFDPKKGNTLQHALIIHGQKSILLGKKKIGPGGGRVVQQIEALPEMLIITITQGIDSAILRFDSEKIPGEIFQRFVKMALREIGIPSASNDSDLAEEAEKTEVTTPNEDNKKKLNSAYVVAIIGAIATLLAALIGILPQFFSPAPVPTATNTPTITASITQSSTATFTNLPSSKTSEPSLTPTRTFTPTSLPREIVDIKGVSMALVPAGEFTMGIDAEKALEKCTKLEGKIYYRCYISMFTDAEPAHQVYLDTYYIDKFKVTNASYLGCVKEGLCSKPQRTVSNTRSSYYGDPLFADYPVLHVTWDQANTYCKWRNADLPTEAQWEKAARGTDERSFPWGEEINCAYTAYPCIKDTTRSGSYEKGQSPYGIYDLIATPREWVADWYLETYYSISPPSNPTGPTTGNYKVYRGGSSDFVFTREQTYINFGGDIGFRCARSP